MKHNFRNVIAFILVISVAFSVIALPVHAEAGFSEALREDDDLGWTGIVLTVSMMVSTIILAPVLLVLTLIFGVEAATDMLQSFFVNLTN